MSRTQGALLGKLLAGKLAALGITRSTRVAVALSGGADSLSLALALSWWSKSDGVCLLPIMLLFSLSYTSCTIMALAVFHAFGCSPGIQGCTKCSRQN